MSKNVEVLLSSTLHDPRGVFLPTLEHAAEVVGHNYGDWIINTTATTDQRVKDHIKALQNRDVYCSETDPSSPIVADKVENDHLYLLGKTLTLAQNLGLRKIQYTDGDRMIMAAKYFPADLQAMAQRAVAIGEAKSYLNFRRSAEDYFTHHLPLVQTELEFNRLYTKVFGMTLDIGSTSHVMSLDVLNMAMERSPKMEPVSFPHPKWLIIAKAMGANIGSAETRNVLTFETPEQFRDEVTEEVKKGQIVKVTLTEDGIMRTSLTVEDVDNNYSLAQQVYTATLGLESTVSPREWDLRFNTARQYLELLRNHLDIFGFDQVKYSRFTEEIERSLTSLAGRRDIIIEALQNATEKNKK